jgi:hypothetical protein
LVTILSRMFLRQRTWALLLVMILIGVIMLAQSAVRSMEPSLGIGDCQMSPLSPFVCDLLLRLCMIPIFIYCDCVYFALDSYSLRKLTVAFNAFVRYVYRRRLFDHISDVSDSILSCSLLTLTLNFGWLVLFFLWTGGRPHYLYDSIVLSRSERQLRINSPRQSTEYMAGSVLAR